MTYCPECKRYMGSGFAANGGGDPATPCPHCGAVVEPSRLAAATSGTDDAVSGPDISVAAQSPGYPRYRNALIIVVFVTVVVGMLVGIHLAAKVFQQAVRDVFKDPVSGIMSMVIGSGRYEVCRRFMTRNSGRFAVLGSDFELLPLRQEVRVVNGTKTATIVARVTGSKGSGEVTFRLREDNGRWRVHRAALTTGDGREYGLYP